MKPKPPSADQGPPAKTGFETEDHPPSQSLEWNQTCAYQSHGTEEIFAAIQSFNSQKKTQELPAVLWEGYIKYNTGGAEMPPRQNGMGHLKNIPDPPGQERSSQNMEQTQSLETVTKTQKQKWKCTKI